MRGGVPVRRGCREPHRSKGDGYLLQFLVWKGRSVGTLATKKTSTSSIHRLKIALLSVKPQVWRRIEVESTVKLSRLSRILLEAMDWTDLHLHQFVVGDVCYGTLDSDFPSDTLDEAKFTLAKIAPCVKDRFRLEYDFGDSWEHRVVVEDIVDAKPGLAYPRCTAGANACPPEDCGGPYGYADLRRFSPIRRMSGTERCGNPSAKVLIPRPSTSMRSTRASKASPATRRCMPSSWERPNEEARNRFPS
jgi:Plasmid pRiA4b ORF-3-like protein